MGKANNAKKLYKELRSVEFAEITDDTAAAIMKAVWDKTPPPGKLTPHDSIVAFKLAARVAHHCDEAQFEQFIEHGEVPPFKLSKHELSILKGGLKLWAWLGIGVGALAVFGGVKGIAHGVATGASAVGGAAVGVGKAVGGAVVGVGKAVGGFVWDGGRGDRKEKVERPPEISKVPKNEK